METTDTGHSERWDSDALDAPPSRPRSFQSNNKWAATDSLEQRYEVGASLGRGGMAEVFQGFDRLLERPVALKFLCGDGLRQAERLLNEARSQASIDHPHICKVYEVGILDGRPCIAMQLVAGRTLREVADGLDLREKVHLIEQVAQAMSVAHRLGVIHRDLKPGNILVERTEDGRCFPYVVDFGLAERLLDIAASGKSRAAGTAPYMAPEQVRGAADLDRRTDVYGLGATLYTLLVGRPPFAAESGRSVAERVLTEQPIPLRHIDPRLPQELEEIVARCLEKEPARRYDSARALAEDLGRFLDGEPILARASSFRHRTLLRLRKHRVLVVVSVVATATLLALLGAALVARWNAQRLIALAGDLGREVNQTELSMRLAYLEPVHDIRRDRTQVRQRIRAIDARVQQIGRIAVGAGHYARGRSHLALGQARAALADLLRAWEQGQRGPEVSAALGRARAMLYEQELRELGRSADSPTRQARVERMERELREPALRDLRAGSGDPTGEPLIIAAELAYLEHRFDDVRRVAAQVLTQDPARFEAHELVGRVELSLGRDLYHQGRHRQAEDDFVAAERAFKAALDVARSHPQSHEDLCEVESLRVFTSRALFGEQGQRQAFERATAACRAATQVDPESGRAQLLLALTHYRQAQNEIEAGADPRPSLALALDGGRQALSLSDRSGTIHELLALASTLLAEYQGTHGIDSRAALDEAIAHAAQAAAESPDDVARRRSLALAWYQRALFDKERGLDPRPALDEVIRAAHRATQIAPHDYDHYNDLACAYGLWAADDIDHGRNPEEHLRLGIQNGREAVRRDAEDPFPAATLADLLADRAEYLLSQHRDPSADLHDARDIATRAISIQEDWPDGHLVLGRVLGLSARHRVQQGQNPGEDFAAARASVERGLAHNPSDDQGYALLAGLLHEDAAWTAGRGRSPLPALIAARQTLRTGLARNPGRAQLQRLLAEGFILEVRFGGKQALLPEAVLPALNAALARNPGEAKTHVALAEACLMMATAQSARRGSAEEWRVRGRSAIAQALSIHPHDPAARRLETALNQLP